MEFHSMVPEEIGEQMPYEGAYVYVQKQPKPDRIYVKRKHRKRGDYWDQFWDYLDEENNIRGECIYCDSTFAADPNVNGTTNVKNHAASCKNTPANRQKRDGESAYLRSRLD
ncbi:unnamed protein product [Cuscuta europaea]|uniref:BED-type domain-containing protein n=1 Tax=Cuscuta europaea TaxID=41803 RepID=A0A9P1DZG8_CUSEU|nr:unnamed protein product [Cuscuta europaea]